MQAIRVETTVEQDGAITLEDLPLQAGDHIEVIILLSAKRSDTEGQYSLRGTPVVYDDPFGSVAEEEWDALR